VFIGGCFEKTKPIFKGKSKKVKVKSESRRVNLWPSQRANSVPVCLCSFVPMSQFEKTKPISAKRSINAY
jgi:hypothetical protein